MLLETLNLLLNPLNVLETELGRDDLHVTDGVDVTLDMDNLGVIESTDDLEDTVDGTDVRQESVAETSTGRSTGGQTGNVDAGQERRDPGSGLVDVGEPVEALVGDGDTSLLGVDGRVREVGGLAEVRLREGVEERRLADVGETDDTDLGKVLASSSSQVKDFCTSRQIFLPSTCPASSAFCNSP